MFRIASPRDRRRLAPLLAAALLICACGGSSTGGSPSTAIAGSSAQDRPTTGAPSEPPGSVRLDEATRQALQQSFQESFGTLIAGTQTPGAIACVSVGDEEWISTLGVAELDTAEPVPADAHVRIASLTKPFVATAILQLVDEGALALDDPLEQYVPGIANGDRITVRNLLDMTSGIFSVTADKDLVARFDADPMTAWTVEDSIALLGTKPPDFEPGSKVVYSDSNYVLLGAILEKVTGQPVQDVIASRIIGRLGLTGTVFPADDQPGVPEPNVVGYLPVGPDAAPVPTTATGTISGAADTGARLEPITRINPQFAWAAGAMTSTARDLARFARELTDPILISAAMQQERFRFRQFSDIGDIDYGYGLGLMNTKNMIGHTGGIIGFGAVLMRYPAADATFVVLVNSSSNFDNASLDIYNALLGQLYPDQVTLPTGR